MQKSISFQFCIFLLLLLLFSCQREIHFPEPVVEATQNQLQRSADGQYQPIQVAGAYYRHVALSDTNFLEVEVSVKKLEAYHITTETINGYFFQASGTFTDTGLTRIQLLGVGIPLEAQQDTFVVTLEETSCTAVVPVKVPVIKPTSFTLAGSPGTCLNAAVNGAYVKNMELSHGSFVVLQANVTSVGPYEMATDTVNGYSFSGSGYFNDTGPQTLILLARGTPQQEGTDVFRLSKDLSACMFSVNVSAGYEIASGIDYFPLTFGSNWTYSDIRNSSNGNAYKVKRTVSDSTTLNGLVYKIVNEENAVAGAKQHVYRKEGGDYFEYARIDQFNAAVKYREAIVDDLLFLKENVGKGASWESEEYSGTISGGQTIILKYVFSCVNSKEVVTVGNKTYVDVIKIRMQPFVRPVDQDYSFAGESTDWYYAQGIGLIYTTNIVSILTQRHWILQDYLVK